jgi:hypothetical protein
MNPGRPRLALEQRGCVLLGGDLGSIQYPWYRTYRIDPPARRYGVTSGNRRVVVPERYENDVTRLTKYGTLRPFCTEMRARAARATEEEDKRNQRPVGTNQYSEGV